MQYKKTSNLEVQHTLSALLLAFLPLCLAALSCFSNFSYALFTCHTHDMQRTQMDANSGPSLAHSRVYM